MLRGLRALSFVLLLAAWGCGGGGKSTYITQYPQWDWEEYERIAVVPFSFPAGEAGADEAARQATHTLEDMLAANGNFTILERDALAKVLTEQDLSQLADLADPSTILPPGKVQIAQALVVGKITDLKTDVRREQKRIPVVVPGRRGRKAVVREEVVTVFRHEGTVAGGVRVIDAATARSLFAYSAQPITREEVHRGSPPSISPQELAAEAARELAAECYARIAPINIKVKLSGSSLLVALDYYDGEYDKTKEISTELDNFLLVVRELAPECNRNPFRVAIAPQGGRNIFEEEFVWSSENAVRGKSWTVPVELLRTAGAEKFVAKLYSGNGEQPILDREFELKPPK
jgi:hypothetical protein